MAANTVNRIPSPSINGQSKKGNAMRSLKSRLNEGLLRIIITIALGAGIPLLSLSLSHLGGSLLLTHHYYLSVAAFVLCSAVLTVSLAHLAWAIRDITQNKLPTAADTADKVLYYAPSWCLAISIDLSLIICELIAVHTQESIIIIRSVMVSVTAFSMALNCWAFLKGR